MQHQKQIVCLSPITASCQLDTVTPQIIIHGVDCLGTSEISTSHSVSARMCCHCAVSPASRNMLTPLCLPSGSQSPYARQLSEGSLHLAIHDYAMMTTQICPEMLSVLDLPDILCSRGSGRKHQNSHGHCTVPFPLLLHTDRSTPGAHPRDWQTSGLH